MPALNRVQIIGRLGKDPEEKKTSKSVSYAFFSVAADRHWKNKKGENQKETDWINIEAWGKLGGNCLEFLKKGKLVYLEGRLQTRKYEQEGVTKYFTTVVLQSMQILDRKTKNDGEQIIIEEIE